MLQNTQYEVNQKQTLLSSSVSTEKNVSLNVVYSGPFLQYSNTWIGYDTKDAYYAIQVATLSRITILTETSLMFPETSDDMEQSQQREYQKFLADHNPEFSVFLALTFGWRI